MDYYSIVDITSWKYENINVSGSKEKDGIVHLIKIN